MLAVNKIRGSTSPRLSQQGLLEVWARSAQRSKAVALYQSGRDVRWISVTWAALGDRMPRVRDVGGAAISAATRWDQPAVPYRGAILSW